jgi:hypothetical protein
LLHPSDSAIRAKQLAVAMLLQPVLVLVLAMMLGITQS